MGHIISFTNQKGGVGKTTSAVNVALSLGVTEEKTLLIDLDPQANATTGVMDISDPPTSSIYDVLIKDVPVKDAITSTKFPELDLIASTNDLVGAEIELVSIMAREYQLQKCLNRILLRACVGYSLKNSRIQSS